MGQTNKGRGLAGQVRSYSIFAFSLFICYNFTDLHPAQYNNFHHCFNFQQVYLKALIAKLAEISSNSTESSFHRAIVGSNFKYVTSIIVLSRFVVRRKKSDR
jgi:hypothetical protein